MIVPARLSFRDLVINLSEISYFVFPIPIEGPVSGQALNAGLLYENAGEILNAILGS